MSLIVTSVTLLAKQAQEILTVSGRAGIAFEEAGPAWELLFPVAPQPGHQRRVCAALAQFVKRLLMQVRYGRVVPGGDRVCLAQPVESGSFKRRMDVKIVFRREEDIIPRLVRIHSPA